ncbi:hypothetical protein HYG77_38125 (plasmid) [Rhodococcus sp. ZPP]|uniref:hypothetical protein n=1 Tax=Rhodococcus sp. ZPP TaxID=2749906 RepID=UPI001AD85C18|nr:hypothetical protein [Rhodococcus sp. ZPP]QTJ71269.1 hypothetical protein HYG77_38125 [Rhodococcus sp. ZPP]
MEESQIETRLRALVVDSANPSGADLTAIVEGTPIEDVRPEAPTIDLVYPPAETRRHFRY